MRSSSGPESRRWWRARSAAEQRHALLPHPAAARVRGGDERDARREDHDALGADDRHAAVLQRLAQRLERRPGELGELVEEEHAVVGERRLARRRAASRRRRARRRRSCGAARGTGGASARPPSCWPAIECRRVTSIASAGVIGGRIDGSRRASIVLPVPGGPWRKRLWPPAAATSSAGTSALWPRTSARSGSSRDRLARRPPSGTGARLAPAAQHLDGLLQRRRRRGSRAPARAPPPAPSASGSSSRSRPDRRAASAIASAPRIGAHLAVERQLADDGAAGRRLAASSCPLAASTAIATGQVERRARPCAGRRARG